MGMRELWPFRIANEKYALHFLFCSRMESVRHCVIETIFFIMAFRFTICGIQLILLDAFPIASQETKIEKVEGTAFLLVRFTIAQLQNNDEFLNVHLS